MFDGLNNNRAHWNELAQVYEAKMKAIDDEKKKLEEQETTKGKKKICIRLYIKMNDIKVKLKHQNGLLVPYDNKPLPLP